MLEAPEGAPAVVGATVDPDVDDVATSDPSFWHAASATTARPATTATEARRNTCEPEPSPSSPAS